MKKAGKKTKNFTLDDLAIMVAKGFDSIDSRFSDIDQRFNKVDSRLDQIEFRLSKIESNHQRRIENIEDKLAVIYAAFEKQLKIKLPK